MNLRGLVWRELIGSSHRRSTYVLRAFYLGLTALLAFSFAWTRAPSAGLAPGRELFEALGVAQILCLGALSLLLAHFSLASEKTSGRLDLLLITGKSCAGIIAGKLAGAFALPLFLFLCGFPAMLIAVSLGGVSGESVLALSCVTLAFMLLAGAMGAAGGAAGSLGFTFALPIVYLAGPILLILLATGQAEQVLEYSWLPFAAGEAMGHPQLAEILCPVAVGLFLSGACLCLAVFYLPRPRRRISWFVGLLRALERTVRNCGRRFAPRLFRRAYPGARPLRWREGRLSPLTTLPGLLALGALFLVLWLLLSAVVFLLPEQSWRREDLCLVIILLWAAALYLAPGVWAASSAAADRKRKAVELMLASPVPDGKIVFARVLSAAKLFGVPLFFLAAFGLVGWPTDVSSSEWTSVLLVTTFSVVAFGCCCGAACGYRARSQSRAVLGYLALLIAWGAGPIIIFISLDALRHHDASEIVLMCSPLPALIRPPLFPGTWWPAPVLGIAASAAALYLSVTRLRKWIA